MRTGRVIAVNGMIVSLIFSMWAAVAGAASQLDDRLDELTQQITQKMGEKSKKKIAVVEFSDLQGNVTDFGRYLSEELITRLVNSGKFDDVVERRLLAKILSEHKLALTDIVDPSAAQQLGKILGVDAIVSGTVSDLGSSLKVNARLIGTERGSIFAAAATNIVKDEAVNRLMAEAGILPGESRNESVNRPQTGAPLGEKSAQGKIYEFQDKTFDGKSVFRVTLVSIQFLEKNRPKVNMTIENLRGQTIRSALVDPKKNAYVLDQFGESYPFKESTQIPELSGVKELAPGVPLRFSATFSEFPATSKKLTVVMRIWADPGMDADVVFRDLDLR